MLGGIVGQSARVGGHGNIAYRRFCQLDSRKVPNAKTMIWIEQLLGEETLCQIFERVTAISSKGQMHSAATLPRARVNEPLSVGSQLLWTLPS
jgi:hypothetical protein